LSTNGLDGQLNEIIKKAEDKLKQEQPELAKWVDENWQDQWTENSGDRWEKTNQDIGWTVQEIRQEFDDFFDTYDTTILTDPEKKGMLDMQMKETMA